MSLKREDFATFFAEMHDGYAPFAWQERLLDAVLKEGRWPERINAPTSAGKTAAIDVHVFARALLATTDGPIPPRRLALVVDRRVLVDDQFRYAQSLSHRIATATPTASPVLHAVRERLSLLSAPETGSDATDEQNNLVEKESAPLLVARLRGGTPPSRVWRDHPAAVAVICATPDMWGSRLLFRGYGSSHLAWPREAGLLALDSVVVVDEAHLAQQLLYTARRVAELVPVAERSVTLQPLQVVETTATPVGDDAAVSVGVEDTDLGDEILANRLCSPKPVTLRLDTGSLKRAHKGASPGQIVDELLAMIDHVRQMGTAAASTVGCFVNTVPRAVAVLNELHRRKIEGRPICAVMVCGQTRAIDIDRLEQHYPKVLTSSGNSEVDVIVSTQSLEVGVDVDFAGIVTELASATALAQRAGRVNRHGLRPSGPVVVVSPETKPKTARSGPYRQEELQEAAVWLQGRAETSAGLAPWSLRDDPPPASVPNRMLFQRPELADAWHWARTSDDLAAEPELDLWLAENFETDTSVGLVVRDALPQDTADAIRLIRTLPPRRHEVFPVPLGSARVAVQDLDSDDTEWTVLRVRGEDISPLERDSEDIEIRPGDVLVLDSAADLFITAPEGVGFSPPVLIPPDSGQLDRSPADDVLEAQAELDSSTWKKYEIGGVVHRLELNSEHSGTDVDRLRADLTGSEDEPLDSEAERDTIYSWLRSCSDLNAMAHEAAGLLETAPLRTEVIVHRDVDNLPVRVVLLDRRRAGADDAFRQFWTPTDQNIGLAEHQRAVAERATALGRALGLDQELIDLLFVAGAHHDDGKQDPRFQRLLNAPEGRLLAKSRAGTSPERARRNKQSSGLPHRWRHEQRSVIDSWAALTSTSDPQLAARLIGTSHGHGRSSFPHTAEELLDISFDATRQLAEDIFDLGGWDELLEHTHRRYGVWVCAYLEAVLRAADAQVSAEGR